MKKEIDIKEEGTTKEIITLKELLFFAAIAFAAATASTLMAFEVYKTKKAVEITRESMGYSKLLDEQTEILELETNDILRRLKKEVAKTDDPFPLIDKTLDAIEVRGHKYEELLSNFDASILKYSDEIIESDYSNFLDRKLIRDDFADVLDRNLRDILTNIKEDGYRLDYEDQHLLLSYDISNIVKKYEDILPKDYVDEKLKTQEYSIITVKKEIGEKGK